MICFWQIVSTFYNITQILNISQICMDRCKYKFSSWIESTVVFFSGIQQNHFKLSLMEAKVNCGSISEIRCSMLCFCSLNLSAQLSLLISLTAFNLGFYNACCQRLTNQLPRNLVSYAERMKVAINALILHDLAVGVCTVTAVIVFP